VIAYVDASVLLRVAFGQPDALPEWRQIDQGIASALVGTECLRTLDRLRRRSGISDADVARRREAILRLISSLELVEVDSNVLDRAAQPMPTELGTLDAIHLATALLWKELTRTELIMATHDTALALGAQAHGLPVIGSCNHNA
jgi:predicted nucleic acid-binding protein